MVLNVRILEIYKKFHKLLDLRCAIICGREINNLQRMRGGMEMNKALIDEILNDIGLEHLDDENEDQM